MARHSLKDWALVGMLGGTLSVIAVGMLGVLWALCSVVMGG